MHAYIHYICWSIHRVCSWPLIYLAGAHSPCHTSSISCFENANVARIVNSVRLLKLYNKFYWLTMLDYYVLTPLCTVVLKSHFIRAITNCIYFNILRNTSLLIGPEQLYITFHWYLISTWYDKSSFQVFIPWNVRFYLKFKNHSTWICKACERLEQGNSFQQSLANLWNRFFVFVNSNF